MGKLYYIHDLKFLEYKSQENTDLMKIEKALKSVSLVAEREWKHFQTLLAIAQNDASYWLKVSTQTKLVEICHAIDVRAWDFEEEFGLQDWDGRFQNFLKSNKDEDLNISWDSTYYVDFWKEDALVEEIIPLYPKDVFAFFILLDRVILFYQEEKRRIKYELMQKRIQKLKLPSLH